MKKLFPLACFLLFFLATHAQKHVPGDLLIQMQPGKEPLQLVAKMQSWRGVPTRLEMVKEVSKPFRIWLFHYDFQAVEENLFLEAIRRQPEVQVAQFNHFIELRETVPNDPNFGSQWQWVNTGQTGGTPDADVDADLAWDITTGGKTAGGNTDIVVAVIEGCNRNQPDLQGNLWVNTAEIPDNQIDDDGNGYVDDYEGWNISQGNDNIPAEGHGTNVSGMIGAKGNNGVFVSGINWDVKIMHVEFGGVNEANSIEAYTYPYVQRKRFNETGGTEGAFVVATNSSWGIDNGQPADAPLWCAFYDSLGTVGILSCGATANNNVNIDIVGDLPTACPSEYLLSVTATNHDDVRTFSGYGTTHVDIGAPGEDIFTISNNGTTTTSGTSFATPLTAGIVALLYSAPCATLHGQALADPAGTALKVRDAIFNGVDVVPDLVGFTKTGGRVNAFNSLQLILETCGPCPQPFGVRVENLIDTTATFVWSSTDSTLSTTFQWRVQGETVWTEIPGAVSPLVFNDLKPCTNYEYRLEEICSDTTSGFTDVLVFKTDGCCEPPKNVEVTGLTETFANVTWSHVLAANSYNVLLSTPTGPLVLPVPAGNSLYLSDLLPCTVYGVQVQTVCDTGATEYTPILEFITKGCGACVDQIYCPAKSQNADNEWIANVSLNTLDASSGSDGGYGNYTGQSTELVTYEQYNIKLTPGFVGLPFNEWFAAWIDFNQDGDFGDAGEKIFDAGAASTSAVSGSFFVPGNAKLGLTRLRVIMRWQNEPLSPCELNFNFGEVEDYCVQIVAGTPPDCLIPNGLDTAEVTTTTATLTWDAVPDAVDYRIRYRKLGAGGWSLSEPDSNSHTLANLTACTEYEAQVRSTCFGENSDFSPSFIFKTDCLSAAGDEQEILQSASIQPNPFSDAILLNFNLLQSGNLTMELFDARGQKVLLQSGRFSSGENQVRLERLVSLPAGVYFLKLTNENGHVVRKALKK